MHESTYLPFKTTSSEIFNLFCNSNIQNFLDKPDSSGVSDGFKVGFLNPEIKLLIYCVEAVSTLFLILNC